LNELNQKLNEIIFKEKSENSRLSHKVEELSEKLEAMSEI
jgi:hypothetical protein